LERTVDREFAAWRPRIWPFLFETIGKLSFISAMLDDEQRSNKFWAAAASSK
jgi:hypothetical protein